MKKNIIFLLFLFFANANDNFYYQKDKKIFLTPIYTTQTIQKKESNQTVQYYKTSKGQTVGISKEIIVKVIEEKSIDSLVEKYDINVKKKLTQKLYLVEINSTKETLTITNKLYDDENVSYAHPNFIKRIDKR